jgi:circadian clock protein KaiC
VSARISTGSREIDEILSGGFLKNSINILMGQPGTGKTVLAEQIAFHNAGEGRPIVYLTTLSEPLSKVVKYLQRFDFFDPAKLGSAVRFEDLGAALAEGGLDALLPLVVDLIRTASPRILVIDSYKAVHDLAASGPDMRRMLYDLTGTLTAFDTTVFLLGEYTDEHARQLPEFAVADGIVQLLRSPTGTRDERFLRVLKLRGSGYLEGQHGFRIGSHGLEVFPRLVSPTVPASYTLRDERVPTGVPGLDAMMGGGPWSGSSTLVAGPTGAGKTTLGLQFVLEGVRRGEPGLFMNFQENPTQLARALRSMGVDAADVTKRGLLLAYSSPVELQIDSVIVTTVKRIRREGIRRVVIDAVGDLMMAASDPQRLHDYLYALLQHLTVLGTTTLLTYETAGEIGTGDANVGGRFSYMSDNLVLLSTSDRDRVRRTVRILKSRASQHELAARDMEITAEGARVLPAGPPAARRSEP